MARSKAAADAGESARAAAQGRLVHVSDEAAGLRRRRAGSGFTYLDANGRRVTDADVLARIRALAIPPAWQDVWICARADGHLQATGRDARGRKQYRYHIRWRAVRDAGKFDRIVAFGAALPQLRRRVRADLAGDGWARGKVAALVVAVMANTLLRIGNAEYARGNGSFGLTTLRNRHVQFLSGGRAQLHFRGKGGQVNEAVLDSARLTRLLRRCQQLPGQALFQYRDDAGVLQPVDSGLINDYLRDAMGEAFTAKDFRTWGGTLAALRLLAASPEAGSDERSIATTCAHVVSQVAGMLGNTPAVCRKSYIDPAVFALWTSGRLQRIGGGTRGPRQWERAALSLLRASRHRAAPTP